MPWIHTVPAGMTGHRVLVELSVLYEHRAADGHLEQAGSHFGQWRGIDQLVIANAMHPVGGGLLCATCVPNP